MRRYPRVMITTAAVITESRVKTVQIQENS
jgi:hypothetical protein